MSAIPNAQLAGLAIIKKNPARALEEAKLENTGFWRDFAVALALQAGDDRSRADEALQKFTQQYAKTGAFQIAIIYAVRKQPEEMFKWLDSAYTARDSGLVQVVTVPFLMNYREDPRFIALCNKLKIQIPAEKR